MGPILDTPGASAHLVAIRGVAAGQVFPVAEEEVSIGRDPDNTISVLESAVSRRHCAIRRDGSSYVLHDLASRNSTIVNGVPVKERLLEHGDQISIGGSTFVFRLGGPEADQPERARGEPLARERSTVVLRAEDARYVQAQHSHELLAASPRTVRDLNVLLGFSQAINSVRELKEVQTRVIESLAALAVADRIAILLTEHTHGEIVSELGWERELGFRDEIACSSTVVRQVIEERAAVLSSDITDLENLQAAASLVSPGVHSVLAAPMEVRGRLLGVIYLDSTCPAAQFDEDLLHLVASLASIAALAIENARHHEELLAENRRLQDELHVEHDMVGDSPAVRQVCQFISRVAGRDSTVLIWGESGTGKELVARAIHGNSPRASKPFVAINCAAITDTLLESEMFGHEKGAFTGAAMQKKGKLEIADGGTVFLDEVGELAPALQAKLLRVLQEREFERVGGIRTIKLDVRLIAATNRDLKEASRRGAFREDLYYRLNVVSLRMPPLRERRQDIPLLANHFARRFAHKLSRRITGISPAARASLMQYDWPGNVRELENAIERAVVLGSTEQLLAEDLPESILEQAAPGGVAVTALHESLRKAKKELIQKAIEQAEDNYTEAAHLLGIHPNHLFRLIRVLGLKPKRRPKSFGQTAG